MSSLVLMTYDAGDHWKRVVGLSLEAADVALATGAPPKTLVLNREAHNEITVCARVEPRVPELLQWALKVKAHVHERLASHGAVLCGPLHVRGQVWPRKAPAELPPLAASGGVQNVAVAPQHPKGVSVDLRFAVSCGTQWWVVLIEQKSSLRDMATARSNAEEDLPKLWEVARKGHFSSFAKKGPADRVVSAAAAGVGVLAITRDEFMFTVEKRSDWSGYPDAITRTIREPLPDDIRRMFPSPPNVVQRNMQRMVNYWNDWWPSPARSAENSGPAALASPASQPGATTASGPPVISPPQHPPPEKKAASAPGPPPPISPSPAPLRPPPKKAASAAKQAKESSPAPAPIAAEATAAAPPLASPLLAAATLAHVKQTAPAAMAPQNAKASPVQRQIVKTTKPKKKKKQPWTNPDGTFNKTKWQARHNRKPHVIAQKAAASRAGNQDPKRKQKKKEWDQLYR